ncbi:MAG: extracellular solute-binding protein [Anaerolineae bacterium]
MISRRHTVSQATITYIVGGLLLLFVVSCTPQLTAIPSPSPTATTEVESLIDVVGTSPRPPATAEIESEEITTPETPSLTYLTLWTVEAISPQAEGEAGRVFGNGLRAFENTHPDVSISVVLKNESGKGSVLDYLRTASQAAPSVMPDVVVLNTVDLAQAARTGLVVPLDGLVSPLIIDDLLPAARAAGSVDGQLVGIPFEMDVEHLIYNTNKVTSTPIVWTDVISANTNYVFPAKGRNGLVNDAFLIQYLALGGHLQDEEGQPFLDEQALRTILEYYRRGVEVGVISPDILTISTPDDIWPIYISAQVGIAHVNAHRFLSDRSVLRSTQFADIPTQEGNPLTISRGQVLAIVARDPDQQALASRLIEWLMAPDNNAMWNRTRAYIPTRYAVFDELGDSDPYWPFLQHQLEIAVPPPAFPEFDQIGRVLQQAVVEVLSDDATPEEAAAAAVNAVTP